ncbi:hypothetical protein ACCC92_24275 [Mucilaginibacter sp. Mucisp84]|uniref:hypothetical protein n=1 Tax=Mucilaginibacter sp. Mucisp84 TaxID=3243058 RepID=UPI0039A5DE57
MKTSKVRPVGSSNVTPEVIAAWKAEYPKGIWELEVDGKKAYFRKPTRDELKAAMVLMAKNDPIGMCEDIMASTYLGGDEEILSEDEYFFPAATEYQALLEMKQAEIKKL